MLTLRPLTSEFVGIVSYAPTCFLDLMNDDVESDSSSIGDMAPSHRPSWECAMADAHAGALTLAQEHYEEQCSPKRIKQPFKQPVNGKRW